MPPENTAICLGAPPPPPPPRLRHRPAPCRRRSWSPPGPRCTWASPRRPPGRPAPRARRRATPACCSSAAGPWAPRGAKKRVVFVVVLFFGGGGRFKTRRCFFGFGGGFEKGACILGGWGFPWRRGEAGRSPCLKGLSWDWGSMVQKATRPAPANWYPRAGRGPALHGWTGWTRRWRWTTR